MVISCVAYGCQNRQGKPGIKFYRFPTDKKQRKKWISAIKRDRWTPSEYSRVCSAHFISKERSRNPFHPDYVPSVFVYGVASNHPATLSDRSVRKFRRASRSMYDVPPRKRLSHFEADVDNNDTCTEIEVEKENTETELVEEEEHAEVEGEEVDEHAEVEGEEVDEHAEAEGEEVDEHAEAEGEEVDEHAEGEEGDEDTEAEGEVKGDSTEPEVVGEEEYTEAGEPVQESKIDELDLVEMEVELGEYQLENQQLRLELLEMSHQNEVLQAKVMDMCRACVHSNQQSGNTQLTLRLLQTQANHMQYTIDQLQSMLQNVRFGANVITDDDQKTCFYTGLPTYQLFLGLFMQFEAILIRKISSNELQLIDEFFIVLVKLRLGVPMQDLACRVNISVSQVSRIFHKWIEMMSVELSCLVVWPDEEQLHLNMPNSFKKHYSRVKCIIDCFEIFIERPTSFEARAQTYSNYKKHNTVKVLIGIAPTGTICYLSKAWGGRISDKAITQKSGFLGHLNNGDDIMADRGFNIEEDLAMRGVRLLIPAFTRGKSQLSIRDIETTRQLARVRIHVERVIGQMRKKYKILQNVLPINLIKCPSDREKETCTIDRMLIVTAALTNLCQSVVT